MVYCVHEKILWHRSRVASAIVFIRFLINAVSWDLASFDKEAKLGIPGRCRSSSRLCPTIFESRFRKTPADVLRFVGSTFAPLAVAITKIYSAKNCALNLANWTPSILCSLFVRIFLAHCLLLDQKS
jgi:hypothetical protein